LNIAQTIAEVIIKEVGLEAALAAVEDNQIVINIIYDDKPIEGDD